MNTGRVFARVSIILGCAFLGTCIGICIQALRITGRPQEFRSLAKIVAEGPQMVDGSEGTIDRHGAIIEGICSTEMRRRALKRVKALHPELRDKNVEIRIFQTKGTAIFNILSTAQ